MDWNKYIIHPKGKFSKLALAQGINNLQQLSYWLRYLDYQRISDQRDLALSFSEKRGTCSSKHCLFQSIAKEQQYDSFNLLLVMFKMGSNNTPVIKELLEEKKLEYIPEAHIVITWQNGIYDLTFPTSHYDIIKNDILSREVVDLEFVMNSKKAFHKNYIQLWVRDYNTDFSADEIWEIRESCIQLLSKS